jgi:hypothetical protein
MLPGAASALEATWDSPLSSARLRYSLRPAVAADGPGPCETRPLGLRFARSIPPRPVNPPPPTAIGWERNVVGVCDELPEVCFR